MTREEAIKSLEAQRDCIILSCQGACHEGKECDECDFMYAKGTMGEMRDAYDVAIKALKEQKVGKWNEQVDYGNHAHFYCSICNHEGLWYTQKYCYECGAKMEGADNE